MWQSLVSWYRWSSRMGKKRSEKNRAAAELVASPPRGNRKKDVDARSHPFPDEVGKGTVASCTKMLGMSTRTIDKRIRPGKRPPRSSEFCLNARRHVGDILGSLLPIRVTLGTSFFFS